MTLLITNHTNRSFYQTNQEQLLTFVVPFEILCAQILAQNHFTTPHKHRFNYSSLIIYSWGEDVPNTLTPMPCHLPSQFLPVLCGWYNIRISLIVLSLSLSPPQCESSTREIQQVLVALYTSMSFLYMQMTSVPNLQKGHDKLPLCKWHKNQICKRIWQSQISPMIRVMSF
jgi:hypothetical protein